MSFDHWVALFSSLISFLGLVFVGIQIRGSTDQRKVESVLQICRINREIIALGFSHRELFEVLHGQKADPVVERHYLQLWFNQFVLIHSFCERNLLPPDLRESLEQDIRDFMAQENRRCYWLHNRIYYSESFQTFIDTLSSAKAGVPKHRPPSP